MRIQKLFTALGLTLTLALGACGGENEAVAAAEGGATQAAAEAAATPEPTGNVIEVKMITDGAGNYFEPADITAKPGDVVRFVLVSGVHNVSFPADRNAGLTGLPAPSQYLQLPGQTYDLTVDMAPGTYEYVCDPHAALGMVGSLTVQ